MEYRNLEELNEQYVNGDFEFPDEIMVSDIPFVRAESSNYEIDEMIGGKSGMIIYESDQEILVFSAKTTPTKIVVLDEAAKKKKKAKPKKKPKKKAAAKPASKGPDIAGLKGNMKNTMDKHKIHLDKHITKHGDVLKDIKKQITDATGAHKDQLQKTLTDVQKIVDGHKGEMEKMASDHGDRMSELDRKHQDLLKTHNDAIDRLADDHVGKLDDIRGAHEEIKRLHDLRIRQMQQDHDDHKKRIQNDHAAHLDKVMGDHGNKIYQMKRDHGDKVFDMRRQHGDQLRKAQQSHQDKYDNTVKSHEENQEQMQQKHQGEIDSMQQKHDESKIGTEAHVEILNLHSHPAIKAKVDTGATICSLHADSMKVDQGRGTVKFTNKQLSPHIISVPVASMSSVKSADGGLSYRPVILLNLRIKDKEIPSVEVNLNDREHMTHPFLIGHNALEKGKFIIDPGYIGEDEEIDFDYIGSLLNESEFTLEPKDK